MPIENRTVSMTSVFAKDAQTTIPDAPVSGISYRDTNTTDEEISKGWPYKEIVDSSKFNQYNYEMSSLIKLIETYGFLPWSNLTNYKEGSVTLGSDGSLYKALRDTGPDTTSFDPVNDTNHTYWENWIEAMQYGIGDIKQSIRSSNHGNWIFCNGQEIRRTLYPKLFEIIGTKYGKGDGSNTFNVPNYTNILLPTSSTVAVKGNGKALGITDGTNTHSMTTRGYSSADGYLSMGNYNSGNLPQSITSIGDSLPVYNNTAYGIATDSSKSGITGNLSNTTSFNFFIRAK